MGGVLAVRTLHGAAADAAARGDDDGSKGRAAAAGQQAASKKEPQLRLHLHLQQGKHTREDARIGKKKGASCYLPNFFKRSFAEQKGRTVAQRERIFRSVQLQNSIHFEECKIVVWCPDYLNTT